MVTVKNIYSCLHDELRVLHRGTGEDEAVEHSQVTTISSQFVSQELVRQTPVVNTLLFCHQLEYQSQKREKEITFLEPVEVLLRRDATL